MSSSLEHSGEPVSPKIPGFLQRRVGQAIVGATTAVTLALAATYVGSVETETLVDHISDRDPSASANAVPTHDLAVRPTAGVTYGGSAGNATFHYVSGAQMLPESSGIQGLRATLSQEMPHVSAPGEHSLVELAVMSDDRDIVEVGWVVDRELNGDNLPHLFVFHWLDGAPTCYNACGFVPSPKSIHPGDPVVPGTTATYGIEHQDDRWVISYDGTEIGYYPDTLWDGDFTEARTVQVFGEVASMGPKYCTDMGNGRSGETDPDAAAITGYGLIGAPKGLQPALSIITTSTPAYTGTMVGTTGLRLGGPGSC